MAAVLTLGATSYSLQELAHMVSIVSGGIGIFYGLHLLTDFYWKKLWKDLFIRKGWYDPKHKRFFPARKY